MNTINPQPEVNASRVRVPTLRQIFWGPLANGFRRIAQWRKQGVLAGAFQENRRQAMRLEALEPRVLLSADLSFTTTTDHDVTVLFDVPSDEIRIVDSLVPATILAQQAAGTTSAVRITGSSSADHVIVDLTTAFDVPVFFEDATGADGDELSVVGSDVVSWTLSGLDEGSVAAAGGITFTDVENLSGDAFNRDTFIIGDAALLVGTFDGGAGGFDTVVMRSPTAVTLSDTEIQTQGGAVVFDIAGFEGGVFEAPSLSAPTFTGQTLLTTGLAEWVAQGPGALNAGQVRLPLENNPVIGAVQDVALHPFDLSSMYVGTVGGGIWKNSDISVQWEFSEFELTDLTADAAARLTAFAEFLKANPSLNVKVVGHTDNVGGTVFNQDLSEDRADTVKQFLVNQGIDAGRLVASGKGETEPVDTNSTPAGMAHNRRVELIVNHWVPLTDQFPSLSVSALVISPRDALGNLVDASTLTDQLVLYAGMGSTSSGSGLFNNLGATTSIGILKSIDGGATWTLLDQLAGSKVTSIQVLPGAAPSGTLVVSTDAAIGNGLFVSTDGGQSFTDVAKVRGTDGVSNDGDGDIDEADERVFDRAVSDLAQDPGNPLRVYAAVPKVGIFVSNDGGVTWSAANNAGLPNVANAKRIVLATSPLPDGPNHPLYVALIGDTELLAGPSAAGALTVVVPANTVIDGRFGGVPSADDRIQIWGSGFDGVDNDADGLIDGLDLDERPATATDGIDNDGDGRVDAEDPVESGLFSRAMRVASVGPVVAGTRTVTLALPGVDGLDNDGNGQVDEAGEPGTVGLGLAWGAGATVRVFNGSQNRLSGIFRSDDLGATWTTLPQPGTTDATGGFHGIHPGAQGDTHFSIVVDPQNPDVVYVGGDRQPQTNGAGNALGATDFTGRLFRFNGTTWGAVTDNGAGGTAPHADSRNAAFRGIHMVNVNDGGIYELRNANDAGRRWHSLNDDLSLTEFYSLAFDTTGKVILGGTQDVGDALQTAADAATWINVAAGDGAVVGFSNGNPIFSNPNLGSFTVARAGILAPTLANATVIFLPAGTDVRIGDTVNIGGFAPVVSNVQPSTIADVGVPVGSVKVTFPTTLPNPLLAGTIATAEPAGVRAGVAGARFTTPFVVNTITPTSLLIGTNMPFESTDVGRTLTALATSTLTGGTDIGEIRSLVYGGREGGVDKPTVIWLGTDPGAGSPLPADNHPLWLRDSASIVGAAVSPVQSYTDEVNTAVMDVAVDPTDWHRVWVLDASGSIWFSPNAGQTKVFDNNGGPGTDKVWKQVSAGLDFLPGAFLLQQIVVDKVTGTDVVLVGGQGGVFRKIADGPWHEYGVGLPNALNTVLDRIGGADDMLLTGTFGRGAWTLESASLTLATPTALTITGSAANDEIVLRRNETQPWLLDVFLFADGEPEPSLPSYSVPFATLTGITIDVSGAGDDDVLIDGDFGSVVTSNATVNVIGGAGTDRLFITQTLNPNDVLLPGTAGPAAGGSMTSMFFDAFHDLDAQKVTWTGLNQVNESVAAVPTVEGIANGLQALADALTDGLAKALDGEVLPGIDSASLARALNGVIVEKLRPKEQAFVTASQVPGSDVIQVDNGSSVLLRLLEAGGLDIGLFKNGAVTDPNALEAALEALDTGVLNANNVQLTVNPISGDPTIADDLLYEVHANGLVLDGVVDLATLGDLELTGLLDVSMTLDLALAFGFDSNGFFIRTNASGSVAAPTITITNLSISGEAVGVGMLGFLGVDMSKASLTLDPGVTLKFTLGDPGVVNDNLIRADELLQPPNPDELIAFDVTSDGDLVADMILNATLDVSAILPGIDSGISLATADLKLTWADITDPLTVDLGAGVAAGDDINEFLRFLDFNAQDIVDRLTTVRDNLDALYGAEIPYLSDSLTDIVDLITVFEDKVLDPLTGGGGFEVPSIQALVRNLATSLGLTADQLGLGYDKTSKELTYHLVLSEELISATKQLGAGIDLGGLADLEFNTNATVGATVTLDTILGVDLDNILGDPRDWFFLKNASATATATIEASDIEASARFGFLSIGVDEGSLTDDDGAGPAEVSLTVQLLDPDNGLPGRVDLREILDNLGNLGDLIDVSGAGKLKLMLPVEFQTPLPGVGLPDIQDGNPDGFALPARSLTVTIPDLSDTDTYGIALGSELTNIDLGKFANIDAAGVVGVLGQLTFWLDQFRHSDAFANLDLPLVGPALDEALQLADGFRDLVLLDDNDTTLDNSKTLLHDLNAALGDAGLGRKLFAANVGSHIALVATDASITSFTVAGATALGFDAPQSGSVPVSKFFAEAVATNAFGDAEGNLAADLSFTVTIGSKSYTVELAKSTTDNNEKIGDDRWKLINGDNAPTFATAQQMALRLLDAFGAGYPGLTYDAGTDSLNFTLDLTQVFASLNLPFAFDLEKNLGPLKDILQLQTSGELALKVSGGLNLEVGIFLGDAEPSDKLQLITPLVDLSEPIVLNDNQRYSAQPVIGKLTGDAHFNVTIDGGVAVPVTVTKLATAANTTVADLVTDINDALALIPALAGKLVAEQVPATAGQPAPQQIQFRGLTVATSLEVNAAAGDPAATDIGVATSDSSSDSASGANPTLKAAKTVAPLKGRLTADVGFTVALTPEGGPTTNLNVALTPAQTADNDYPFTIVNQIQAQLDPSETPRVKVGFSNGALTFSTLDGSAIEVKNVTGTTATNELGIVAGLGNSDDLLIKLRNGSSFRVAFDSGDTTIQDIIDAIEGATPATDVTVAINAAGSGLDVTDHTLGGSTFKIEILNNSTAGLLLGIVRPDSSGAEDDPPDGIIEGADIAALTALDRFFVKATPEGSGDPLAGLKVEIGTPVPLTASAKFGFVGLGLQGEGGLPDLGINPEDRNALRADLTLRLLEPAGSTDGRVSLAEMLDALDNLGSLFDISLTGQGQLDLSLTTDTISSLSLLGIDVGSGPRIEIAADMTANVFDGNAPIFTVTPVGFDELDGFGNLDFNFQSIVAGLSALVDFLDDFEALSFLNDPIPVIDVSVKDLVSIAQQFADAVTAAQNDPAGTLQLLEDKLKAAFGLPLSSDALNLLLVDGPLGSKILKIDTQLTAAFSKSLSINLDLGLDPLEFGGDADLLAEGSLRLDLDFGFDIANPTDIYVFSSTGIVTTLNLAATDLDFKAAVGPLGVFVTDGSATINGTLTGGLPPLPANTVLTAGFQGAFGTSGAATIGDIDLGTDLTVNVGGALDVDLPVFFPTESVKAGTVKLNGTLGYTAGTGLTAALVPSAVGPDGVTPINLTDLFAFDPGNLSLLDQLLLGVDGIDLFLEGLQDLLDGQLGGFTLPLVGDKLSGAADAIGDFRDGFVEGFRKTIEDLANPALAFAEAGIAPGTGVGALAAAAVPQGVDPVSKLLWQLLGDPGLKVVASEADIVFDSNIQTETDPEKVFFDWDIHMADVLVDAGAGIGFDLGIPGLGLETEGEIDLNVDWALDLGFGLNFTDGFYLDIGKDRELQINATVTTPGLGITGRLGFLQIEAHENVEADEGAGAEAERGDTGLTVQFGVDLYNRQVDGDDKLGFAELGRLGIDAKIAGQALADLQMELKLNSDLVSSPGNFPSIVADFAFDWGLGTVDGNTGDDVDEFVGVSLSNLKGNFLSNGLQYIGFHDVGLDLGQYFSDVIGPIVEKVQEVTAPIKPFLDFLTEPIPVISDLAGPTSLLDIASMSGLVNPGIIKAIEVVDQVVDIVDSLSSAPGDGVILYFDSVLPDGALVLYEAPPEGLAALGGGGSGFLQPGDLAGPINLDKLKGFASELNLPDWASGLVGALGDVAGDLAAGVNKMKSGSASGGFKIDIIDDPTQIFGMLMGQPANLVSFTMAPLELEAEFSAFFSIFGPLGVSINAEFGATFGPFTFGYDTYGITQFAASDFRNPLLLFDGLYVGDLDAQGNDIPELQFDAGLWAAAELNLGIARGGVGGGLFAEIDMNLYDPDHDGKVRIKEFINTISNEIKYGTPALSPLSVFDISGKLTAELFAFLKIDFGFFVVDEKFLITDPIELLSFENVWERWPTLATELGDGVLQLNMGKNAGSRVEGVLTDGDETFYVKPGSAGHVLVWAPDFGVSEGEAQEYLASKILAYGGDGNDKIIFQGGPINASLEFYGDAGNDIVDAGALTGASFLVGGSDNDQLTGGSGADTLFGGTGVDTLTGGAGDDWLIGDGDDQEYLVGSVITVKVKGSDANDFLYGQGGNDLLFGAGGTDTLEGDDNDDVLIGDGGEVTLVNASSRIVATTRELDGKPETNDPGRLELAVRDTSKNGKGAVDNLDGGAGIDHLYGGFGNDILLGGDNADVIYGELGTDTADGGGGDDVVFGDAGVFKEVTVGLATTLEPFVTAGGEKDDLSGGDGNDKLLGGAGNDKLQGNDGNDSLWGGVGQDKIWGDTEGGGGTGNDFLYGEADSDELRGGAGDDYLEGGGSNDLVLGGDGLDTLVAGYGSDTVDGQGDGDTYRISVRGGSTTELTTVYDGGGTGVDTLVIVGTPGDDTLLLRAMADSYFPTQQKLDGLIERYFLSSLPDRLAGMIQSFNDAYGPWDLPPGLVDALTAAYQANPLPAALHSAVAANRSGATGEPGVPALNALIDEVLASDAASKIEAMKKAITAEYAKANNGAGATLPNTLFSALIAAYRPALDYSDDLQVAGFINGLKAAIAPYYVAESLYPAQLGLESIVDQVYDAFPAKIDLQQIVDQAYAEYPSLTVLQQIVDQVYADVDVLPGDRLDAISSRTEVVFGEFVAQRLTMLAALQAAWDALPDGTTDPDAIVALKAAIADTYEADADEAAAARFDMIKSRVGVAYGDFTAQRSSMQVALEAAWDDLLGSVTPPTETEQKTALKDAVSDTYDDDAEAAAAAKFDKIKSLIEEAYVDRRSVSAAFTSDEFASQRTSMLAALQMAWDALPASPTEAQQKADLKTAISATYTADPVDDETFTNTAFVAVINDGGKDVERFNYRRMEGLVVSTLAGNDYVVFDDLLAAATINLGDGSDRVQVGQVFRSERVRDPEGELITGIRAEDVYTTIEITRGWLSNGVSVPTTINGGDGDDNFTVFRNVAVLNLNGGDGDDVFTVRAFALKGSSDNERARTDMKGDGGADTILYVVNAPVGIDGGDGFDTVRIVGTEFGDDFVVTDSGVFGAGLNVSYVNVERLVADGAEGDDRFFVQSTGLDVVTEIDGGLGSDTYFVGGNPSRAPVPVVSNDLRGHSGILLHSVESDDSAWDGLAVEGLSANVGDDEEAMILLAESGGRSMVLEGASGVMLGVSDTYTLRLSRAPVAGRKVVLAVVPAGLSPEEQAKNYADLEVWDPTLNGGLGDWADSRTVELNGGNWSTGVEILFRAKQDVGYEGRRFTFINHKITEETTDVTFLEAQTRSLKVQMEDDDRDGVIIVPSDLGNTVLEGGFTDSFQVVLTRAPTQDVTITLTQAGMPAGQVLLNGVVAPTLTFTSTDWDTPQTVIVSAADDGKVEGFHTEYIRFDVSSADADEIKGPFTDGQSVMVNGTPVAAALDMVDGKVWLQMDGDIDAPGIQVLTSAKPSTFVLLPHRPIAGTVSVRVGGEELSPGVPESLGVPAVPARFSVTGNTVTFLTEAGAPEFRTGKVEVNYQYKEVGYDGSDVRDQVVDIYDTNTPTVIIRPVDDGMVDVVEGDNAAVDTYTVRLASAPAAGKTVDVVIDSVKTRTSWGANAYFEKQIELSLDGITFSDTVTLTFDENIWDDELTVIVRALDDDRIDGNDTQVFAPDLQTVNKIRGPLIIEGAAGAGSLSLPTPLMMPWELNIRPSDGNVVAFDAADSPTGLETMTVELEDLEGVVADFRVDDPTFTLAKLVGKTLEMSKGAGTDVVLDESRPDDKFDRFWLIKAVEEVADDGNPTTPRLVTLTLENPTAVDPTHANVIAPDEDSEYAITSLSVNFFADEREQVDYLFVYDNDSVADDVGSLTSSDGVVLGFGSGTMTVETSALQRAADLLGLDDLHDLENLELTITVGPGTGHVYLIDEVSDTDGETKELTLIHVSGDGDPSNRSEFRIAGSDRYGRITGFGMGPNVLFAGRPQGGGITYGDIEVVQVELGLGDDTVRVDYATNAEDHATERTGDFYTLTILNTGGGDDEVTVVLDDGDTRLNGDGSIDYDGSVGDGAFALNTGEGTDTVLGALSTRQLVVFGGEGVDDITTGSGDDIVFGDLGRVDYTKKITVGGVEYDSVVTRLGSSVPQNPVNPHVTFATDTTITDDDIDTTFMPFPIDDEGLVGLSVQVISPEGHVQFRTVIDNTSDTITVDAPWAEFPVYNADDENDNYYYRVSSYPDDQTDGLFRGPRVIWSVKDEVGGDDTIHAGSGNDIVIGGAGDDPMLDGGSDADYVLGDDARFDFVPVIGSENGSTRLLSITDPGTIGDDTLLGGDEVDLLIGGLGDDTISGEGNDDVLIGDDATVQFDVDGVTIISITTTNRENGGIDTSDGGADDDIVIGGANSDNLDGGLGRDLVFGDNVLLVPNPGSGDSIGPRFRALSVTAIYDANGGTQVAPQAQPVPGGLPIWADWHFTLDQSLNTANFGDDYIAGGGGNDEIFGQLGDDTIQGDGSINFASTANYLAIGTRVGAARDGSNALLLNPSFEAITDGDDYIEGNGGNDVIFGNLGQDDIIGGSSNLFSLRDDSDLVHDRALRPDGSDLIFGGAGADIVRNNPGDGNHGRDADMILGDNGNIYRLVADGAYRQFNYDATYGMRIIPRAAELLDYTPGGIDFSPAAAGDIGAADELHGESGDDFIYGMAGSDVLFGEGQDDDLIGGYGNDWISGGSGDDGVIGDDGRIVTSRNGTADPLGGVAATTPGFVQTGGGVQQADLNVTGQLKKTVNITPFGQDPAWTPATDEFGGLTKGRSDDIIFGGWGNDFLHGGTGDDAISGAEALAESYAPTFSTVGVPNGTMRIDYDHPVNPANVLAFNPIDANGKSSNKSRAGEFYLYNEYDALRRIMLDVETGLATTWTVTPVGKDYFLNFDSAATLLAQNAPTSIDPTKRTDGDDKIFGDFGNDWLVGGSGRDNLYGGFGNDLLNANDDLSTHNSLNDQPVMSASYEDRAFGGAGRDVLIANTGGDRLIDWTGEFNSYLVPFSPFGNATVSRTLQPALPEFLYALSASDGADPTRAGDIVGADATRNGEPWGELGLVLQKDDAWKDQHGGPADPQPGNIGGTKRDVLRSADFTNGAAQGFTAQVGASTVVGDRYQVTPAVANGDAVSLFNQSDTVIPVYFEMQATINAVKATGGNKANAYLIFDWQSNTDFKFAGIDVSTNKLVIGHRTASAWVVDNWTNVQVKADTDYVIMLKANNSTATAIIGNKSVSFTFAPRIDSQGVKHLLNDGITGIGTSNGASAQIDNVVVQKAPEPITVDITADFGSTNPASKLFKNTTTPTGSWVSGSDGRFTATSADINAAAIDLASVGALPITAGSLLNITTTLKTSGMGGVVFDYQGPGYYKYVVLSKDTSQILVGHRANNVWITDATYAFNVSSSTDYSLGVSLRGGLVNVSINGAVLLSHIYAETVTMGGYGLISRMGVSSGVSSFDIVQIKSDEGGYAPPTPLLEASASDPASLRGGDTPSAGDLVAALAEAKARWAGSGLDAASAAKLDTVTVQLADLPGAALGEEVAGTVFVDLDAAGRGWFIDPTPQDNSEFHFVPDLGAWVADAGSPAFGRMDLLTVVEHEIGHVLGFDHGDVGSHEVMAGILDPGVRYAEDAIRIDARAAAHGGDLRLAVESSGWNAVQAASAGLPSFDLGSGPSNGNGSIDWQANSSDGWKVKLSPYASDKPAKSASPNFAGFLVNLFNKDQGEAQSAGYDSLGRALLGKGKGR